MFSTYTFVNKTTGSVLIRYFYNMPNEDIRSDESMSVDDHMRHFKSICWSKVRYLFRNNERFKESIENFTDISAKFGNINIKNLQRENSTSRYPYKPIEPPEGHNMNGSFYPRGQGLGNYLKKKEVK